MKFVYDKWSFTKGEVAVIKKYRHFDQVKRVEKSPKAKQGFIACYHTRRYKSLAGFSIYAKAFDMCCRTRYALKGVMVRKEYRHFDQVKRVEKSPKAKQK